MKYIKIIPRIIFAVLSFSIFISHQTFATEHAEYSLNSGDSISIMVFGEEELNKKILLSDTGVITYPFIGEVLVKGLTVAELEQKIHDGLKGDYLVNPNVSVSIVSYRSFFIEGQVKRSGGYPYQPGLTIAKAVALAGGLTERASTEKVFIVRASDEQHAKKRVSMNVKVEPGDIISIEQSFF